MIGQPEILRRVCELLRQRHAAQAHLLGAGHILGCGPVGLMAVLAAVERSCRVFAVDRVPERLDFATRLGAIAVGGEDAAAQIVEQSGGGVDSVVEAIGASEASRLAYEMLRPGGTLSVVGVHNESTLTLSPSELYDKNLGLRIGRCPARGLMPSVLPLALQHATPLRELFSQRLRLQDAIEAYRVFAAREAGCLKVLLALEPKAARGD